MMTMRNRPLMVLFVAAGIFPAAFAVSTAQAEQASQGRLIVEMQQMREELRDLRVLVEDQQRELERLRERQRDQYLDLDRRLQQAGTAGASTQPAPRVVEGRRPEVTEGDRPEAPAREIPDTPPVIADPEGPEVRAPIEPDAEITPLGDRRPGPVEDLGTPTDEEQEAYDRAFRALRELRYADAAEGFTEFVQRYPNSAYAPNAQYWLGESFYVTRDFETALSVFDRLLSQYPGSSKEGDALLKVGFSHYELRQWNEARAALEQVSEQYAGTTLARLAENRLRAMRLEGHL